MAVMADAACDVGQVGYEMARLVETMWHGADAGAASRAAGGLVAMTPTPRD